VEEVILAFCSRKSLIHVVLFAAYATCHGQEHLLLCSNGFGTFSTKFATGVTVTVDATKKAGGFSTHTCEASLGWGKEVMPVALESSEIDIDALGADLGLNTPVVAFQIKSSALDHLMTYKVYSLEKPARLLRTITGGDWFSAGDTNLEGRTEIWTNDAGAVDGFEGVPLSSFDFAPTVVLRFEKQKLIDVSSEYQSYFDRQIAQLKNQLDGKALAAFKDSDGRLQTIGSLSMEELHLLKTTKIKVLEIVWSYLYSGREEEAWRALASMWPSADLERIRSSVVDAQARGIRRQVDGVSSPNSHPLWKHHAQIYLVATEVRRVVSMATAEATGVAPESSREATYLSVDAGPQPIFLGTPRSPNGNQPVLTSTIYLNLVIDAAGKVRSAGLANASDKGPVGEMLIESSTGWKFIPAFKAGRAVACQVRFGVWPYR
jgi:hypothetical protein